MKLLRDLQVLLEADSPWTKQEGDKSSSFIVSYRSPIAFSTKGHSAQNLTYELEEIGGQLSMWLPSDSMNFSDVTDQLNDAISSLKAFERVVNKELDRVDRLIEQACNEQQAKLPAALASAVKLIRFRVRDGDYGYDLISDVVCSKEPSPAELTEVAKHLEALLKEGVGGDVPTRSISYKLWWSGNEKIEGKHSELGKWELELVKPKK